MIIQIGLIINLIYYSFRLGYDPYLYYLKLNNIKKSDCTDLFETCF